MAGVDVLFEGDAVCEDGCVPTALWAEGESGEARRAYVRECADAIFDLAKQSVLIGLARDGAGIDLQSKDVLLVEPGIGIAEIDQAAEKEACADHEDERERHLGDDEGLCQPALAAGGIRSARCLERVRRVESASAERWDGSENQGCRDGDGEVEEQ